MVRIRKGLKHSPLIHCSNVAPEDLQPHICRLNQSGWDVNPLPEFEAEDDLNVNKSGRRSGTIGAAKSVVLSSEMDVDKVIIDVEESSKSVGERNESEFKKQKICKKNDGKEWYCKRKVEEGYSFCTHHLTLIRTYHNNNSNNATSNAPKSMSLKKPKMARGKSPEAKVEKGSNSCKSGDYVYYLNSKLVRNMDRMVIAEEETTTNSAVESDAITSAATTVTLKSDPPSAKADYENQLSNVEVNEVNVDGSNICGRKRSRKMKNPKRARIFSTIFPTETAKEETTTNVAVESDAITSSATSVTLKSDPPSAKVDYENQRAYVEVKADGSKVCGRKRSRKMKNPVRAKIFSSIFPTET
ncbi:hypothetical protein ACLB2K_074255 [Fragaria x ananassa]